MMPQLAFFMLTVAVRLSDKWASTGVRLSRLSWAPAAMLSSSWPGRITLQKDALLHWGRW